MASMKSRELAGSVVMVVGLEQIMREYYTTKGGTQIWPLLGAMKKSSERALTMATNRLTNKDRNKIADRVMSMKKAGFESAGSFKIYLSFCILLISDRISELSEAGSHKAVTLKPVLSALEAIYKYFDIRVKREDYDIAAMNASDVWYQLAA